MATTSLSETNTPTDSPSEHCSIFDHTDPHGLIRYVINVLSMVQHVAAFNPAAFETLAQPKRAGSGIYFLVTCLIEALGKALEGMEAERVQSSAGDKLTQTNSLPCTSISRYAYEKPKG
jgi:hypothetical protein